MTEEQSTENTPFVGLAKNLKRIDRHYITHELLHLFHIEKGFLYNVKQFILRPAASIKEFLLVDRSKHMKPIGFLIFTAILYTFIYNYFSPAVPLHTDEESYFAGTTVETIQNWLHGHFGYNHIIKSFLIAFWTYLFFKKEGFNIFEIMTLLCFVSAQGMLLIALLLPLHRFLPQSANNVLLLSTATLFPIIVIAQFFDRKKPLNYLKATITYFLGGISQFFIMIAIGLTIDFVMKFIKH